MKYKIIILLIILSVLSIVSSCNKKVIKCPLTKEQKELIPYEQEVYYNFIDSSGQNIKLIVTEIKTEWYKESDGSFIEYDVATEHQTVILKSNSNNLEICFSLISPKCDNDATNCRFLIFISSWWFFLNVNPDGTFIKKSNTFIHENVKINNKIYYNIVEQNLKIKINDNKGGITEIPIQLFYNKTEGILQINKDGKNYLTINE